MKLRCWYTVWGRRETAVDTDGLLAILRPHTAQIDLGSHETDDGIRDGMNLSLPDMSHPMLLLSLSLAGEKTFDSRCEALFAFHELFDDEPHAEDIKAFMSEVCQLINLTPMPPVPGRIGPAKLARTCEMACGFLARESDGIIQVYQEGFFDRDGMSLLPYNPSHRLKTH